MTKEYRRWQRRRRKNILIRGAWDNEIIREGIMFDSNMQRAYHISRKNKYRKKIQVIQGNEVKSPSKTWEKRNKMAETKMMIHEKTV